MAKEKNEKQDKILIYTKDKLIRHIPESKLNKVWKATGKSIRQAMEERGWKEGINPKTKLPEIKIVEQKNEAKAEAVKDVENN